MADLEICPWLDDATFAYTVVYDEAFVEVLANAYPIHERLGIPGHLAVVAGQIGKRRNCFRSSLNGYFHMNADHLQFLISRGWSVSNHSYSHFVWPDQPGLDLHREVVYSRYLLEDALGIPISYFTIPNNHANYEPSLPYVREAGYTGCKYPVTGELNTTGVDLLKVRGIRLCSGPEPHGYLPEELRTPNLTLERLRGRWLVETTHLVQPDPVQPHKNVSCADLEYRLSRIADIGGERYWPAVPEDVVDYLLTCRNVRVRARGEECWEIDGRAIPVGVRTRALSLRITGSYGAVRVDGEGVEPVRREQGGTVVTIPDVGGTCELRVTPEDRP